MPAIQVELIKDGNQLDKAINRFARDERDRDQLIHQLAVSCLWWANEHGDLTRLSKLHNSFGKMSNKGELRHWLRVMSTPGVEVDNDGREKFPEGVKSAIMFDNKSEQFKQREGTAVVGNLNLDLAQEWTIDSLGATQVAREQVGGFDPIQDINAVYKYITSHYEKAIKAAAKAQGEDKEKLNKVVKMYQTLNDQFPKQETPERKIVLDLHKLGLNGQAQERLVKKKKQSQVVAH